MGNVSLLLSNNARDFPGEFQVTQWFWIRARPGKTSSKKIAPAVESRLVLQGLPLSVIEEKLGNDYSDHMT